MKACEQLHNWRSQSKTILSGNLAMNPNNLLQIRYNLARLLVISYNVRNIVPYLSFFSVEACIGEELAFDFELKI